MNNVAQFEKPVAGARFVITAEVEGFPVSIELEGRAEVLKATIDRLKAIGATPPQAKASAPTAQAGPPVCPVHHTPMKESRKPCSFFCSKKLQDGQYCSEKA